MPHKSHIRRSPPEALASEREQTQTLAQAEDHYRRAERLEERAARLRREAVTLEVAARQELHQADSLVQHLARLKEERKAAIQRAAEAAIRVEEQARQRVHQQVHRREARQQEVRQQEVPWADNHRRHHQEGTRRRNKPRKVVRFLLQTGP